MLVLGKVLPDAVGLAARTRVRISHGQRTDLQRRPEVILLERRRKPEHIGNVVEAVGRVIRRQQRCGIHVESQQVADGVAVFGAVEAVERRTARVRMDLGSRIELRFEPGRQVLVGG